MQLYFFCSQEKQAGKNYLQLADLRKRNFISIDSWGYSYEQT